MSLTTQQEQVLALISAGSSITDAAQSAGIHRNTILNWFRSAPDFQHSLDQARQAKALYWQEQAEDLAAEALATIRTLMTDPKTPTSTRLRAAQLILNLALNPPKSAPKNVHKFAQSIPEPKVFQEVSEDGPEAPEGVAAVSAGDGDPGMKLEKMHNPAQSFPVAQDERPQPYRRPTPKIGRNEPCPCHSGKKFKHCCLGNTGSVPSPAAAAA